jgi:hypothetical protein
MINFVGQDEHQPFKNLSLSALRHVYFTSLYFLLQVLGGLFTFSMLPSPLHFAFSSTLTNYPTHNLQHPSSSLVTNHCCFYVITFATFATFTSLYVFFATFGICLLFHLAFSASLSSLRFFFHTDLRPHTQPPAPLLLNGDNPSFFFIILSLLYFRHFYLTLFFIKNTSQQIFEFESGNFSNLRVVKSIQIASRCFHKKIKVVLQTAKLEVPWPKVPKVPKVPIVNSADV